MVIPCSSELSINHVYLPGPLHEMSIGETTKQDSRPMTLAIASNVCNRSVPACLKLFVGCPALAFVSCDIALHMILIRSCASACLKAHRNPGTSPCSCWFCSISTPSLGVYLSFCAPKRNKGCPWSKLLGRPANCSSVCQTFPTTQASLPNRRPGGAQGNDCRSTLVCRGSSHFGATSRPAEEVELLVEALSDSDARRGLSSSRNRFFFFPHAITGLVPS